MIIIKKIVKWILVTIFLKKHFKFIIIQNHKVVNYFEIKIFNLITYGLKM